ncbi:MULTISPECIES: glycoside hydrolase family 16 protein [unclassified Mycobacterium]|uniref:glycoside hydrolase family 16 protein n=1 Tax=unclassified Mycobacterium TaxID=2642494 RepID=UPI00056C7365|nr:MULTISPECIES: glycoside hydrolase family 16 protein [unclassified Mycobacterium]
MNRRQIMMMLGAGALAAAAPTPQARAVPAGPGAPGDPAQAPSAPADPAAPAAPTAAAKPGGFIWHDEFDGPAGSAPDPSKWTISNHRTPIRRPVGWDRPEYFHQYRDSRKNVFLDGKSNLVIRGTQEGTNYFGGLVHGNWRGGIGTTWEARIKLDCQTSGAWPAWWLSNDDPGREGEIDLMEWYGNGEWPSGTTVHANPYGTAFETFAYPVDNNWHTWRVTWNQSGMYFWQDYVEGKEPYFSVPAVGIENIEEPGREWPFNDPGYTVFPILNLAIGGSGGGDARAGNYPADMLIDWVRVF